MKRRDIAQKYKNYGFSQSSDAYDLLEFTGGRLAGDNYEFVKPIMKTSDGLYTIEFFVRGMQYYENNFVLRDNLDKIYLKPDVDNIHDENAIAVLILNEKIGYVPAFYAPELKEYLEGVHKQ
jgi:hypothetical protein